LQNLEHLLSDSLNQREERSQTRHRLQIDSPQNKQIVVDGKKYLNFSSNDYLGLANHPKTLIAVKNQVDQSGFGSGASHLITGHHKNHEELEIEIAIFLQRDSAITFSTGYMANLAILQSLAKKGDLIIADKLNHASLIDGAKLSDAQTLRYQHCDLLALENRLKKEAANKWVVTDSVFSMDGDIAPLNDIAGLCKKYNAYLMVDDAHGFGILGEKGRGCAEYFNLDQSALPILMGTLGKALGSFGAFVSGSKNLTNYLMQFARPYMYTTALPASVAAASLCNLKLIKDDISFKEKLETNISYFKSQCGKNEINLLPSNTAIQPLLIGNSEKLMKINSELVKYGILVGAIRPPTVAENSDRLRITLTASHSKEDIKFLIEQLANLLD
jgi:8-amino-7-oxononanoate synthase